MFQITPIGSCRIAGPLQLAQHRFGYAVNKARSYGYCHSSGEAVQMARFMLGEISPPEDIWPLVARNTSFDQMRAQTHEMSDLYVVELSSSKRITINGVFLQLNYLTNAYRAFFADHDRARGFWEVAAKGKQRGIDAYLAQHCSLPEERALLRRVRIETTTAAQLINDMKTLIALLPRVFFVTHVNARKPSGAPLQSRSEFIAMVKDAAHQTGATVYDPTQKMLEVGQKEAIADYSEGLAHYTNAFAQELVSDWVDLTVAPAIDDLVLQGNAASVEDQFAPHASACIKDGAFRQIEPRLTRLIDARPDLIGLEDIAKQLCTAKNDAEGLYERLNFEDSDPEVQRQKLALAFDLDKFSDLSRLIISLEAMNALPPTRQLLQMGKAAADRNYMMVAITTLSTALNVDPDSIAVADLLAKLLLRQGQEALSVFPNQTQQTLLHAVAPLLQIRLCDAGGWDNSINMALVSNEDLVEIVAYLTLAAEIPRAATFVTNWRTAQAKPPTLPRDLIAIIDRWHASASKTKGRDLKLQLLCAVLKADPQHSAARKSLRDLRRDLRDIMRTAAADHDQEQLDGLVAINDMLPSPLAELDLYRARERFAAKDYPAAIRIGLSATRALPDNISIWVLLMRAAVRSHNLLDVDRFARQVIAMSDRDTSRLEAEAVTHLHRNANACALAAKSETNRKKAAALRKISRDQTPAFRQTKASA